MNTPFRPPSRDVHWQGCAKPCWLAAHKYILRRFSPGPFPANFIHLPPSWNMAHRTTGEPEANPTSQRKWLPMNGINAINMPSTLLPVSVLWEKAHYTRISSNPWDRSSDCPTLSCSLCLRLPRSFLRKTSCPRASFRHVRIYEKRPL
jgi:hypothetical protein